MCGGLLQLVKCVRKWGTVHVYGALQGGGHVTVQVREAECESAFSLQVFPSVQMFLLMFHSCRSS
jgi:hypothetical protein